RRSAPSPRSWLLAQLDQHAVPGSGMEKGDAAATCARHRRVVDEAKPLRLKPRQMLFEVVHAETEVMDPLAALFDELRHPRLRSGRLEQLEVGTAGGEERRP